MINNGNADYHVQGPQINQFNNIAPAPIPRSSFKRDFTRRTTFNADYLVPIFLDEILPGDDVNLSMTAFTRMATPIKPLMDNLYMETFWFFVPNRLVWEHWEAFQGQQDNPLESTTYTIPTLANTAPISTTGFAVNTIYDYFGLPLYVTNLANLSCLYNRAYDLIWQEWFRDENLQPSITIQTGDGPDDPSTYTLRTRNKRKDYFTSCLPWPQKGNPVTINLGGEAPIVFPTTPFLSNGTTWGGVTSVSNGSLYTTAVGAGESVNVNTSGSNIANSHLLQVQIPAPTDAYASLSVASGITINALRQAALYQQILELDARGGTRYVESIYSRFGVVSPDFRLQRPELIGQGSTRINVYAVPQTAPTSSGDTPQGNLAAFGTSVINGDHRARYSATEHGMILGLAMVRADLTYQQTTPKMFLRSTRLDFYEPLQNGLGEQAVTNQELYAQGTSADEQVFGYQERFSEYRYKNSEITGLFRSTAPDPIDIWHLAQDFGTLPVLGNVFVSSNTPMSRIQAVETDPSFLSDISFSYTHVRPMPIRSNPGITRL